ncbi:hypothetical protein TSMEX_005905 [Taenia solium]|eukprot:TsM_000389500 transcript=TsM_000389500 gene=TsM_000389500
MHPFPSLPILKLHYLRIDLRRGSGISLGNLYLDVQRSQANENATAITEWCNSAGLLCHCNHKGMSSSFSSLPAYVSQTKDVAHFVFPALLASNSHDCPRDDALKNHSYFSTTFQTDKQ